MSGRSDGLADLDLRAAGRGLRSGDFSAVDLTRAALDRIDATEPAIHAYVHVLADEALTDAARADADLSAGLDRGPLHGIPIAIKDIFDVAGVPTKCGSRVRDAAAPATADAAPVARLRAAGAVILGKTVTQEFAAGVVSVPARNPRDPSRIPGGSSGGSAAAVAAGSAFGALGSDTGGSIRIPAALCGVVGLKPTYGAVSLQGVYPLAWSLDTAGPIARTVADAALMLDAIADDPSMHAGSEIRQSLRGVRLGVPRPHFFDRLQPATRAAVERSLETLSELGAEVIETPWFDAAAARATSFLINRVETVGVHGEGVRQTPALYGDELRLRIEANALYPAEGYLRALRARGVIRASVARLFADHRLDALVTPVVPGTAVPADDLFVRYEDGSAEHVGLAYTRLTMPFNATGQPAISVPAGNDPAGLPIGLQFAGRPHREARLCRIAAAFERAVSDGREQE